MSEPGPMEQCRPPWHTVECYTGQLPGICGEPSDPLWPNWQPILEDVKAFSLAHLRNDMPAVDEAWAGIDSKLRQQDAERAADKARIAELEAALRKILARGEEWLRNDHDYSTAYADRPEADRAANTMQGIARAALKPKEAQS